MALNQIDAFLAVVEYGNFAGAANSLFLTQSALGHRISKLENELGTELFMRARGIRRVELTENGERFVPIARDMKRLWTEALSLREVSERLEVRINCIFSLQELLLSPVVTELSAGGFKPYVVSSNTRGAILSLESGDADFALVGYGAASDAQAYSVDLLAQERLVMISRKDSPYASQVNVADLDPAKEIYSRWNPACESWHLRVFGDSFAPLVALEDCRQIERFIQDMEGGWAIVPQGVANDCIERGIAKTSELDKKPPSREVMLLSRRPVMTACRALLMEVVRDSLYAVDGFTLFE